MQNLLDILVEQQAIKFNGRVNILGAQKELLGTIYIQEGNLINCRRHGRFSLENLFYFAFLNLENISATYITEPEVITDDLHLFKLSVEQFKKMLAKQYSEYQQLKKLRPPADIKLLPRVDFLESTTNISPEEFDLLSVISEYSLVKDIYFYSPFSPMLTTKLLVSLRKVGAIAVLK